MRIYYHILVYVFYVFIVMLITHDIKLAFKLAVLCTVIHSIIMAVKTYIRRKRTEKMFRSLVESYVDKGILKDDFTFDPEWLVIPPDSKANPNEDVQKAYKEGGILGRIT